MRQQTRAENLTICYRKRQIDVSFKCNCPVIGNEFHHSKVVCRSTQLLLHGSTATLAMWWWNLWSITGQTHKKLRSIKYHAKENTSNQGLFSDISSNPPMMHRMCVAMIVLTPVFFYYYTLNSLSLFWLVKSLQWIFKISACDVITADYTTIISRTLKVTGNHVMYGRGEWFQRVIMSSLRTLCCSPSVKKQKHDFNFFRSMHDKTIIRFGFCDI